MGCVEKSLRGWRKTAVRISLLLLVTDLWGLCGMLLEV